MSAPWRRSSGLDPDARAYCLRSGATDRRVMSEWVRGLKGLGIWDEFAYFPLLQDQSAGAGSGVIGLGGAAAGCSGTLVNGPTWGPTGITFSAGAYMDIGGANNLYQNKGAGWLCAVFADSAPTAGDTGHTLIWFSTPSDTTARFALWSRRSATYSAGLARQLDTDGIVASASNTSPGTTCHFLDSTANWAGNSVVSRLDGVGNPSGSFSAAGLTANTGSGIVRVGAVSSTTNRFAGTIALIAFSDRLVSLETSEALRSLYKSTLGKGLGLP